MSQEDVVFFLEAEDDCTRLVISTMHIVRPILSKLLSGEVLSKNKSRGRYALYANLGAKKNLLEVEFVRQDNLIRIQKVTLCEETPTKNLED